MYDSVPSEFLGGGARGLRLGGEDVSTKKTAKEKGMKKPKVGIIGRNAGYPSAGTKQ